MEALGIKVEQPGPDNPEALALLAWHELVEEAEKELPLLIVDNQVLKGRSLVKKLIRLSEECNMLESLRNRRGGGSGFRGGTGE